MNSNDLKSIESQRQALLGQLTAAETAVAHRSAYTRGFGDDRPRAPGTGKGAHPGSLHRHQ